MGIVTQRRRYEMYCDISRYYESDYILAFLNLNLTLENLFLSNLQGLVLWSLFPFSSLLKVGVPDVIYGPASN